MISHCLDNLCRRQATTGALKQKGFLGARVKVSCSFTPVFSVGGQGRVAGGGKYGVVGGSTGGSRCFPWSGQAGGWVPFTLCLVQGSS